MKYWTVLAWVATLSFVLAVIGAFLGDDWFLLPHYASAMLFAWANAEARNRLEEKETCSIISK